MSEREDFAAFVLARRAALVRFGWALTGDRELGEDLAQVALHRVWGRWARISQTGEPLAYTHQVMVSMAATWRRRRWRGEVSTAVLPEQAAVRDEYAEIEWADLLTPWLASLPPRQRAVVILRFMFDLSLEETAARMGCSVGTVKSQASKALTRLRRIAAPALGLTKEDIND